MSPQMKSLQQIRQLAASQLSLQARIGYVLLLLLATGMTVVIASLWLTEAALPLRTQLAFGAMCLIGLSWASLSAWALRTRRPLFARDRVIAGRMAVAFCSLFVAGAGATLLYSASAAAVAALLTGTVMLGVAIQVLLVARRRFAELRTRQAGLAAQA